MERLTPVQLSARCVDAWETVPVGSKWKHRKGGIYEAKGVALTSDDLTPVVIYQETKGGAPAFTRHAKEFLDGRFTRIEKGNKRTWL